MGETMFGYLMHALQRGTSEGILCDGLQTDKTALVLWAYTIGVFVILEKKEQYLMELHGMTQEEFMLEAFETAVRSICKGGKYIV